MENEHHHHHHHHEHSHEHSHHEHHSHSHSHEHHHHSEKCECGHEHVEESKTNIYLLIISVILFIISLIKIETVPPFVYGIVLTVSALLAAFPVGIAAAKSLSEKEVDENLLMCIAVIAALILGEFTEAAAVAIFFRIGEAMEDFASKRSRESIRSLSEIKADTANILTDTNDVKSVRAKNVPVGTHIVIYPHEKVPLDCVVTYGNSSVDSSAITGESIPVPAEKGTQLLSGMINFNDTLIAKTTNTLETSTASRIIQMVEEASARKGNTQKLITKIAKYYTPAVVGLAFLVALIPSIITGDVKEWVHRALVLLVASCPCALVLSVPLGFYTGMGKAARSGILVKGSKYIEETAAAQCVVFDKTGTLTTDVLKVSEVKSPFGLDSKIILLLAEIAECHSSHPIAKAIKEAAPEIEDSLITDSKEIAGYGAISLFCGKTIMCGGKKLFDTYGCAVPDEYKNDVLVAVDGRFIGAISIKSEIRSDAEKAIKNLRESGIGHVAMLTGDSEDSAKEVAKEIDIDEYYAELLPDGKLEMLEKFKKKYGKVIYVGDGINDAPVLSAATVGVGMGFGSQAANEAADMVLTNDSLSKLSQARTLSQRILKIIKGNIIFIMAVKALVLILGIAGAAPMWLAVFADVGVCLISVIICAMIASDDILSAIKSVFIKEK